MDTSPVWDLSWRWNPGKKDSCWKSMLYVNVQLWCTSQGVKLVNIARDKWSSTSINRHSSSHECWLHRTMLWHIFDQVWQLRHLSHQFLIAMIDQDQPSIELLSTGSAVCECLQCTENAYLPCWPKHDALEAQGWRRCKDLHSQRLQCSERVSRTLEHMKLNQVASTCLQQFLCYASSLTTSCYS